MKRPMNTNTSMDVNTSISMLLQNQLLATKFYPPVASGPLISRPRLAALLDFLHNALGFTVVADILAPLLDKGTPARSANEVARTLQAALNKWLSDRLESSTHLLQARRIRAFLASRGSVAPEAIDDELIGHLW